MLIHPSQRALKQGFPKPANKSLPRLTWYSVAASPVFMLLNEQWNNKQIQVIGALHLLRVSFDSNCSLCTHRVTYPFLVLYFAECSTVAISVIAY